MLLNTTETHRFTTTETLNFSVFSGGMRCVQDSKFMV
nr:MAG TPA: hypothetical protein [Caudoviricetes sp.]